MQTVLHLKKGHISALAFVFLINGLLYIKGWDIGVLYFIVRNGGLLFSYIYIIKNVMIVKTSYAKGLYLVSIYVVWVFICSLVNNSIDIQLILYLLNFISLFVLSMIVSYNNDVKYVLKGSFWYFLLLCVTNDIDMILRNVEDASDYLVGNKFDVSYYHFVLFCIMVGMSKIKNVKIVCAILTTIVYVGM